MSGLGWIAAYIILKGLISKPNKESWPTAIAGLVIGTWLIHGNIPVRSDIDLGLAAAGVYAIIVGILEIGCLTFAREKEDSAMEEEGERPSSGRSPRRTSAVTSSVPSPSHLPIAAPTESVYAPSEESPILVEESGEPAMCATPAPPSSTEEDDEEENTPTLPPTGKPLAGKRVCVTGKLPYKRKAITDFIVAMGGEVQSRVTRQTDLVVAGEDCGAKLGEAERRGISIVGYDGLLALCGLTADCNLYEVMPREFRAQRIRERLSAEEAREYGKEFKRRLRLLTEVLTTSVSDILPKAVQVVSRVDDELELHRISSFRSSPRGELVLLSTEGEAIYLNDLTGDSVVRLLAAYGR